jgi:hypothetical protein
MNGTFVPSVAANGQVVSFVSQYMMMMMMMRRRRRRNHPARFQTTSLPLRMTKIS